jgi:hypothetical protein
MRWASESKCSRFSQCFLLDDFALRTILKTALNIAMHRSRDVFEQSKRVFFCFARDFFALGADLLLLRFILKQTSLTQRMQRENPFAPCLRVSV